MELVLEMPKDKPPFIGVLYHHPHQMKWGFTGWFDNHPGGEFTISMKPSHELVFHLVNGTSSIRYSVQYDALKLLKFILKTQGMSMFNFGLLKVVGGKYEIAKTDTGNKMALKVTKIEVVLD